jgi:hypothetical protein
VGGRVTSCGMARLGEDEGCHSPRGLSITKTGNVAVSGSQVNSRQ